MKRFTKKPVTIEAIQFTADMDSTNKILAWLGSNGAVAERVNNTQPENCPALLIGTLEGVMKALPGDWIIRGIKGEFYPCERDIFEATYSEGEAAVPTLSFSTLRRANKARLPLFKNRHGEPAHSKADGSDWNPAQWLQAVVGELGEYANIRKKFERGDLSFIEYEREAKKELADVQTYLDILALRALDKVECGEVVLAHPTGVDLGEATRVKFNEVSERVGCPVRIDPNDTMRVASPG